MQNKILVIADADHIKIIDVAAAISAKSHQPPVVLVEPCEPTVEKLIHSILRDAHRDLDLLKAPFINTEPNFAGTRKKKDRKHNNRKKIKEENDF